MLSNVRQVTAGEQQNHARGMSILWLHFVVTCLLVGLICTIQFVHYPAFRFVPEEDFRRFSDFHTTRMGWLVGPVMIAEFILVGLMLFDVSVGPWVSWTALGLSGVIWLSTAFIQVPLHEVLALGKSDKAIERLVATNWLRTVAWILKAGVLGQEVLRHY